MDLLPNPPLSPTLSQDEPAPARAPDVHADLRAVLAAWPTLPTDIQGQILALIQGHQRGEVQP